MPVLERAVADQVEREVAGSRAAREPGQQPAALGGAEIERERTLRQIQARLESGPGGSLIGAVQIERDICGAAGRAGPHAAGQSEHCILAEHRRADLEPVDADGAHDHRRDGPRQFGQGFAARLLALRQAVQGEPARAQLLDVEARAQQGRRRRRQRADRPAPARHPRDRPCAVARAGNRTGSDHPGRSGGR